MPARCGKNRIGSRAHDERGCVPRREISRSNTLATSDAGILNAFGLAELRLVSATQPRRRNAHTPNSPLTVARVAAHFSP